MSGTPGSRSRSASDELLQLHADACTFFRGQLTAATSHARAARALLALRAVPAAAVNGYEIGVAAASWTAASEHLRGRGYSDAQILDSGLGLRTRRGVLVDRFRDRLMFPVHDAVSGRIVAFLGRGIEHSPAAPYPKYLNSPTTQLYRKSEQLYGLSAEPTRRALAAGALPVLVEGPLDAIAVTQAGDGQYVGIATASTALTPQQVARLDAVAGPLAERGVAVAFDSDPPGRQAAVNAFKLLLTRGAWPALAALPDGQDPASVLQRSGPCDLRRLLDETTPLADLAVDASMARWDDRILWVEGRLGAAVDAARVIATLPSDQVGRQVSRVAARLGLDYSTVTGAVIHAMAGTPVLATPDGPHSPNQTATGRPRSRSHGAPIRRRGALT